MTDIEMDIDIAKPILDGKIEDDLIDFDTDMVDSSHNLQKNDDNLESTEREMQEYNTSKLVEHVDLLPAQSLGYGSYPWPCKGERDEFLAVKELQIPAQTSHGASHTLKERENQDYARLAMCRAWKTTLGDIVWPWKLA